LCGIEGVGDREKIPHGIVGVAKAGEAGVGARGMRQRVQAPLGIVGMIRHHTIGEQKHIQPPGGVIGELDPLAGGQRQGRQAPGQIVVKQGGAWGRIDELAAITHRKWCQEPFLVD